MTCTPPFSKTTYTVPTPAVDTYSYSGFELLDSTVVAEKAQFEVYLNGVLLTVDTDYTVDENATTITLSETPDEGDFLLIQRNTEKCDRYVDFVNNNILNEKDLDLAQMQVQFIAQEAYDLAYDTIRKNTTSQHWDGLGLRGTNFAPGIAGTDLVTVNQAYDILSGSLSGSRGDMYVWGFEGDGAETDFDLLACPLGINSAQLLVTVDGVVQEPSCDPDGVGDAASSWGSEGGPELPASPCCGQYTVEIVDGVLQIQFAVAPANNACISVRLQTGMFAGRVQPLSITRTEIADDAVGLAQLDFDAGNPSRIMLIDSNGDPSLVQLTAGQIINFSTQVLAFHLNSFAAPTADISMDSHKITDLTSGTAADEAVNKGQMDAADAATIVSAVAQAQAALTRTKGASTDSSGVFEQTVNLGYRPNFVIIYWTTIQKDGAGDIYDIGSVCFGRGTDGTEIRRSPMVNNNSGAVSSITHEMDFSSTGFTYRIPNQSGGDWRGTIRYFAFK